MLPAIGNDAALGKTFRREQRRCRSCIGKSHRQGGTARIRAAFDMVTWARIQDQCLRERFGHGVTAVHKRKESDMRRALFGMHVIAVALALFVPAGRGDEPQKTDAKAAKANRLAREISPYLLQHAHNPVDWYPWGEEAFAKAKKEGKLVFLSIGYSSCHWCHVMERESFSNAEIAKLMNDWFVCIKVDREE